MARFTGKIGRTNEESQASWPAVLRAREGAPNVLLWVIDDTGFGQLSPFGGPVEMPTLQRLSDSGVTFTNFHTTALCSPTRSSLLTGRNHHSNHMACITEGSVGFPGGDGRIPLENGFLSEMLTPLGYAAYAVGKWHLTPNEELHMGAERTRWPLGRGFERYYGFLGGDTDQWDPDLAYDNHYVERPAREPYYHLTEDLTDKAIEFITDLKGAAPSKPFFMYLAYGANHAPHHSPPEWSTLSADEQRLAARFMECFAGFSSHMDHEAGRLLDFLDELGELENTVIVFASDNGASAEGGPHGLIDENQFFNQYAASVEENLARIDDIGTERSYNHYPWGWTWAGDAPFRRWKRETHRGGTADPFVVSWPAGITDAGTKRWQFVHAIDVVPTPLELLGAEAPDEIRGVTQSPVEGTSFGYLLNDPEAPEQHTTQYYEMFGHRAIYNDGWRAVCPWPGPSFTQSGPFGQDLTAGRRLSALRLAGR
jgi:arylsulfatase A-like enzyme